jgi:hypothetical protein
MVAVKARRRSAFQGGAWIKMADGREWLFSSPPALGVHADYDALAHALLEAEDRTEARKCQLAIAIFLLSRNYEPSPSEYVKVFYFGSDDAAQSSAEEAISSLIRSNLDQERRHVAPGQAASATLRPPLRTLPALISSCATRVRSTMAPWLH